MPEPEKCTTCTGAGRILDSGNEWEPHPDCKWCGGSGYTHECPRCNGIGEVRRSLEDGDSPWMVCPDCKQGRKPGLPPLAVPTLNNPTPAEV